METTGQIYTLLPKVMDSIGAVGKDRRAEMNGKMSYAFRGIDDLYNAVQPALIASGVSVIPHNMEITHREERVIEKEWSGKTTRTVLFYTILRATYRFVAPDGSFVEATTIGEAMDSGDKSANKAMSAAMKYALLQVLCIPTEEPKDTENDTHTDIAPKAPTQSKQSPNKAAPPPQAKTPPASKPPVGSSTLLPAIKVLHQEWANAFNNGTLNNTQFVKFSQSLVKESADLTKPANWDLDLLSIVGEAIQSKQSAMMNEGAAA